MLPAILLAGMVAQLLWLAGGAWKLRRIHRSAVETQLPEHLRAGLPSPLPRILLSNNTRVAFLAGILRPAIVLPADALTQPREHLRMVLCHELAHLHRRDNLLLLLCGLARVIYWWNPLAWLVLARLRRERERACDDMVIGQFRASDYASLLVNVARVAAFPKIHGAQLAMATGSGIEGRVRAVLDDSVSRGRAAGGLIFGLICALSGAAILLCTVRLVAAAGEIPSAGSVAPKPPGGGGFGADRQADRGPGEVRRNRCSRFHGGRKNAERGAESKNCDERGRFRTSCS
jgi:beta-lactamase regulating signal transducer with metallopeptidase domain